MDAYNAIAISTKRTRQLAREARDGSILLNAERW